MFNVPHAEYRSVEPVSSGWSLVVIRSETHRHGLLQTCSDPGGVPGDSALRTRLLHPRRSAHRVQAAESSGDQGAGAILSPVAYSRGEEIDFSVYKELSFQEVPKTAYSHRVWVKSRFLWLYRQSKWRAWKLNYPTSITVFPSASQRVMSTISSSILVRCWGVKAFGYHYLITRIPFLPSSPHALRGSIERW